MNEIKLTFEKAREIRQKAMVGLREKGANEYGVDNLIGEVERSLARRLPRDKGRCLKKIESAMKLYQQYADKNVYADPQLAKAEYLRAVINAGIYDE